MGPGEGQATIILCLGVVRPQAKHPVEHFDGLVILMRFEAQETPFVIRLHVVGSTCQHRLKESFRVFEAALVQGDGARAQE